MEKGKVVSKDGEEIGRITGYMFKEDFKKKLNKILDYMGG